MICAQKITFTSHKMAYICSAVIFAVLLLIQRISSANSEAAFKSEALLFKNLFRRLDGPHNAHIRPVVNSSDVLTVHVGVAVLNLLHVDEQRGSVSLQIWQRMTWQDVSLTWDPEEYGGATSLQVPPDQIWTPDVVLYNSAAQNSNNRPGNDAKARFSHDGHVTWIPPVVVSAICSLDLTYYPKDKHQCHLKIGSWAYDGSRVNLVLYGNKSSVDMNFYDENPTWRLEGGEAVVNKRLYPCCKEPFYDITFHFTLFRRSDLLEHSLAAPVIMLAILAPFVFLVPARNSHKSILGVGLLISLSIFMSNLGNVLPATASSAPLICKYYVSVFFLLSASICLSSLILCASGGMLSRTRRPPRFIKKLLVDRFGRLCCVPTGASLGVPEADHLVLATVEPNLTADQSAATEKSHETRRHPSSAIVEWVIIAHVMDRILFVIFEITSIILIFAFFGQL